MCVCVCVCDCMLFALLITEEHLYNVELEHHTISLFILLDCLEYSGTSPIWTPLGQIKTS